MSAFPPLRFQFFWLFFSWNLDRTCEPFSASKTHSFLSHSKFVMLTEKSLVALARNTSSCFNKSSAFIQRQPQSVMQQAQCPSPTLATEINSRSESVAFSVASADLPPGSDS